MRPATISPDAVFQVTYRQTKNYLLSRGVTQKELFDANGVTLGPPLALPLPYSHVLAP